MKGSLILIYFIDYVTKMPFSTFLTYFPKDIAAAVGQTDFNNKLYTLQENTGNQISKSFSNGLTFVGNQLYANGNQLSYSSTLSYDSLLGGTAFG